MDKRILIIDFGSQVTQLIARRVREAGVYAEIYPCTADWARIKEYGAAGIILSGGPASVHVEDAPTINKEVFELGVPVLGICYGQQLMCQLLGGNVSPASTREFGRAAIEVKQQCQLYTGVWGEGDTPDVWMSHGDKVDAMPEGFSVVASSEGAPHAVIANESRHYYGVQFHPEVAHTPDGAELLSNFVHRICGIESNWSMAAYREQAIRSIRERVGDAKVICGLSGGVD